MVRRIGLAMGRIARGEVGVKGNVIATLFALAFTVWAASSGNSGLAAFWGAMSALGVILTVLKWRWPERFNRRRAEDTR